MFSVNDYGRLVYRHWRRFSLPSLDRVYDDRFDQHRPLEVAITGQNGRFIRSLPLYRLRWPGQTDEPALIPTEWLEGQDRYSSVDPNTTHNSLLQLSTEGHLPLEDCDTSIVYHLAVNRADYFTRLEPDPDRVSLPGDPPPVREVVVDFPYNMNALAPQHVQLVTGATFALPPEYIPAIQYVKWLCETHWGHPLLQGFDTVVREHLLNISLSACENFFYLLGDCYNVGGERNYEEAFLWQRCARYFFWTGRTGGGLVWGFSDLGHRRIQDLYPDIQERYDAWEARRMRRAAPPFDDGVPDTPQESAPNDDGDPDELLDLMRTYEQLNRGG